MKWLTLKLLTVIGLVLMGCDTGLYITKSQHIGHETINKLVSIEPKVKLLSLDNDGLSQKRVASFFKEKEFTNTIKKACAKNKIELDLFDIDGSDVDADYFNKICLLRVEILNKLSAQLNEMEELESNVRNTSTQLGFSAPIFFFEEGVEISMDYHNLSDKMETPYFSVQGLYRVRNNVFFINSVVDVVRSEFVYTEVRRIVGSPSPRNLVPILYDSFAILKARVR